MDASFETAILLSGVTAFVQLCLNFLTAAYPSRPSWLAYGLALLCGIGGAFLYAAARGMVLGGPVIAQLIILGVFAAAAAAGLNYQTLRAEDRRATAQIGLDPAVADVQRAQLARAVEDAKDGPV